ncbi:TM1266 family iron-only hydrogenase system putative regulator [Clostridium fallax]|uniref:Putative iron-only hydrogenase system regulator n=1 Tax=Clostridium fallax TaxID=1533 RepID=A0A1M4ZDH5_9CLOT|nr:TM1266 family iron-only hydrogenase system putative regulator [Clostridium fallax]SHF16109.1 putative iron-only hydrogenase system regulator [Clostridium fallax]SQB22217.1 putative iron-only hydrogenase system regulator [Clostridium fallax]
MENRVGVIAIVIEDLSSAPKVNETLHSFANIIVGRMGIPYKEKGVSVISIIIDGTTDEISALTGKLGRIPKVNVKSAITKN